MANTPSNKQLSRDLSNLLHDLGFGRIQRWERIHHWNIQTRVKNLSMKLCINTKHERVFIGSLREGLGLSGLADLDVLQVDNGVLCIEQLRSVPHDNRLVLRIVESKAPPGYCFLELSNSTIATQVLENYKYALVKRNKKKYIGSKLFLTKPNDDIVKVSEFIKLNTRYYPQHGPSIPKSVSESLCNFMIPRYGLNPNSKIDFVRALPCDGQLALKSWQHRSRPNNWPSKKMIRHIMTLPIYVVPVGLPGSRNEDIQWRISFVRAETYLIQSLNNVQAYILVVLKHVGKYYLEEGCPCITSYTVKNVMFLLAESIPQKKFRQKHIMARLKDALELLKDAVNKKTLPSYMQPEKNLFANKLSVAQQKKILGRIDYLLRNDKMLVHACLHDQHSVNTVYNDVLKNMAIVNKATKHEICTLAMYQFQSQVLFYLKTYKLNCEEEHILHSIPIFPKFIWKYGIKGWNDARTVNLYKHLAHLDREDKIREMEHEMLHTSDKIQKEVYIACALISFLRYCLSTIVLLCKSALLFVVLLIMNDTINYCKNVSFMLIVSLLLRYKSWLWVTRHIGVWEHPNVLLFIAENQYPGTPVFDFYEGIGFTEETALA